MVFACMIFLITGIAAQEKNILTLDEYLKIIKDKIPELKQGENDLNIAENRLKKSYSTFDPVLASSTSYKRYKPYTDSESSEAYYTNGFMTDVYLKSVLPSGTRIDIGAEYLFSHSQGENTITSFGMNGMSFSTIEEDINYTASTFDPVVKISITQPLLYNWFGFIDRYAVKDAKNNLLIERLKKEENENTIDAYYKKLYFAWAVNIFVYDLLENTIDNMIKLEKQTKDKLNKGVAEKDEYERVRYSVLQYNEQIKNTQYNINVIKKELSLFFDTDKYIPDMNTFDVFYNNINPEDIKYTDFYSTRTSRILNLNKKSLEDYKKLQISSILPRLDIFGNLDIRFHSYEKNTDDTSEAESYHGEIDLVVGLQFSYPLGSIKSRGELKEAELMIKDIVYQLEITKNNYEKTVNKYAEYSKNLNEILDLKSEGLKSLDSIYRLEKIKYNQGRIELRNLLETENDIFNHKINIIQTKLNLINLYFDYKLLVE